MPRRASPRADPRWTIIRRMQFAYVVRDTIYGRAARPFGRVLRHSWARMLAHYTRSRALTYGEVLVIAKLFARNLQGDGNPREPSPPFDAWLRTELSCRLAAAAHRKAASLPPRDDERHRREQRGWRGVARFRQWDLDGWCLGCGQRQPCERCGRT